MLAKADVGKVYETVLSIPGMNDKVKVNLQMTRKNILLLSKVIERGLNEKHSDDKSSNILDVLTKESLADLSGVAGELLSKAGLNEMNERLREFY